MASSQVFSGSQNIGRLTGKDVKAGKNIRKDEQGFEVFDDYFSDTGSEYSAFDGSVWNTSRDVSRHTTPQVGQAIAVMTPFSSDSSKNSSHRTSNSGGCLKANGAPTNVSNQKGSSKLATPSEKEKTFKNDAKSNPSVFSEEKLDATLTEIEDESGTGGETPKASAEEQTEDASRNNSIVQTASVANKSLNHEDVADLSKTKESVRHSQSVRRSARKNRQFQEQESEAGNPIKQNAAESTVKKTKQSSHGSVSEADTPVHQTAAPKTAQGTFTLEKPQVDVEGDESPHISRKSDLRGTHTTEKRKPLKNLASTLTIEKNAKRQNAGGTYTKEKGKPVKVVNKTHTLERKHPISKSRIEFGSETDDVTSTEEHLVEKDDLSNENPPGDSSVVSNESHSPEAELSEADVVHVEKDDRNMAEPTSSSKKSTKRSKLPKTSDVSSASAPLKADAKGPSNDEDSFKQPKGNRQQNSKKKSAKKEQNTSADNLSKTASSLSMSKSNISQSTSSLNQLGNELGSITRTENHTKTTYMESTNSAIASFRTRKHLRFSEEAAASGKPKDITGVIASSEVDNVNSKQVTDVEAQLGKSEEIIRASRNQEIENLKEISKTDPPKVVSSSHVVEVLSFPEELHAQVEGEKSGIEGGTEKERVTSENAAEKEVVMEMEEKESDEVPKKKDHSKKVKPVLKMLPKRGLKSNTSNVTLTELEIDSEFENSMEVQPRSSKVSEKSENTNVASRVDSGRVSENISKSAARIIADTNSQEDATFVGIAELSSNQQSYDSELEMGKTDKVHDGTSTTTRSGRAVKRKKNSDPSFVSDEQKQHPKAKRRSSSQTRVVSMDQDEGTNLNDQQVSECIGVQPNTIDKNPPRKSDLSSHMPSKSNKVDKTERKSSMFSVASNIESVFSEDDEDDFIVVEAPVLSQRPKATKTKNARSEKVKRTKKVSKAAEPQKEAENERKPEDAEPVGSKRTKENRKKSDFMMPKKTTKDGKKSEELEVLESKQPKKSSKKSEDTEMMESKKTKRVSSSKEAAPKRRFSKNRQLDSDIPGTQMDTDIPAQSTLASEADVQVDPGKSAKMKTKKKSGNVLVQENSLNESQMVSLPVDHGASATPVVPSGKSDMKDSVHIDDTISFRNSPASLLTRNDNEDDSDQEIVPEQTVGKAESSKEKAPAKGTKKKAKKAAKVVSSAKRKKSQKGASGSKAKKKVVSVNVQEEKSSDVECQPGVVGEEEEQQENDPILIDGPSEDVAQFVKGKKKSRKSMVTFSPSIKKDFVEVQHLTACPQVQSGFVNRARRRTFPEDPESSVVAKRHMSVVSFIMNDSEIENKSGEEQEGMTETEGVSDVSDAGEDMDLAAVEAPQQSILKKPNTPHRRCSVMFSSPVSTPLSLSGETPKATRNKSLRRSQLFESTPIEAHRTRHSATPNTSSIASESIKHYFEVTNSKMSEVQNFPKRNTKVIPPAKEDTDLRRSKRNRMKPLAYYKNERPDYRRQSDGFVIAGIISPALDMTRIEKERHRKVVQRRRNHKKTKIPGTPRRLSTHDMLSESVAITDIGEIPVFDSEAEQEVMRECIFDGESLNFINGLGQPATENDDYIITRPLKHATFSSGYLLIRPLKEKPMHKLTVDNLIFSIIRGKIAITINRSTAVLESGDKFLVPCGNCYSIRNLRKDTAKLDFTSTRHQS